MGAITLKNFRTTADVTMNTRLKDGGVSIDWADLTNIKAWLFSDAQKAIAGRCDVSINQADSTLLVCEYSASKPQYLGVNRLILQAKYQGRTKTYDVPVFNFVSRTAAATGTVTIDDPTVDVEIEVQDVTSSILDNILAACIKATEEAREVVDVGRGPRGFSAYELAVQDGFDGTEDEWLASLEGEPGPQGIQGIQGPVGPAGVTSAVVTVDNTTGTPSATAIVENGVLIVALSGIKGERGVQGNQGVQGETGATPVFTIGTVETAAEGEPASVTITGTPSAPVLNLKLPRGLQGNTGSSVAYPFELVNNRTTDDATKGLSAAEGYRLGQDISQLETEMDDAEAKLGVIIEGQSVISPNLFDKTAVTTGKGVRKDLGTLYTDANFCASDYIPVPDGATTLYYSPAQSYGGVIGWAFYNANKEFTHGGNSYTPAIEEGDAYFRLSVRETLLDTTMLIAGTSADLPDHYVPYGTIADFSLKDGIVETSKIADGAVTLGKMSESAIASFATASQGAKADADNAFLQPSQAVIKSTNLLDLSACQHGYIDNRDGTFHAITPGGAYDNYFATDFIPVSENGLYCSCYAGYGTVGKGAVYDANKVFLRALNSGVYEYVAGDGFVRWTISNTYTYQQINEGNERLPYEPYFPPIITYKIGNPNFKLDASQILGTTESSRSKFNSFRDTFSLNAGERGSLQSGNFANVTKDFCLDAEIVGTIESVEVGFGNDTSYTRKVVITPTSLVVKYGTSQAIAATYTHGLTLGNRTYLHIERTGLKTAKVILRNEWGETFTQDGVTWLMQAGAPCVKNGNASAAISAEIALFHSTLGSRIWVFGDSYCSYSSEDRWPYYAGRGKGWLLNSYPGIGGEVALANLQSLLSSGAKPAYIVWAIGMNGGEDVNGSLNTTWKGYTDALLSICEQNRITPVFQTIPSVPNYRHEALNTWIKNSGYRYIDIASVVEEAGTYTWRGWGTENALLSNDQVHPTTKGAMVMAAKYLSSFPELNTECP